MEGTITRNGLKHEVSDVQLEKKIKLAVHLQKRIATFQTLLEAAKAEIVEEARQRMEETGLKSWEHQGVFGLVKVRDTGDWKISPAVAAVLREKIADRFTGLVAQKMEYGLTPELRAILKADQTSLGAQLRELIPYKDGISVSIVPRQD
jgi:hypothetical protein